MYGQLPKNRFFHGFSEADLGHASLFLKLPCSNTETYFVVGKTRLKGDERKQERRNGKVSRAEKRNERGAEKSAEYKQECNRRTEKSAPQATKQLNCICTINYHMS